MDISTSRYGHLKYTVKLADLVALAGTSGNVTLDSLPPGAVITAVLIKATTAVAGTTTATARASLNGTVIGTGTVDVAATTGALQLNTVNPASLTAANALVAAMVFGSTSASATAGQFDVIINWYTLAP